MIVLKNMVKNGYRKEKAKAKVHWVKGWVGMRRQCRGRAKSYQGLFISHLLMH